MFDVFSLFVDQSSMINAGRLYMELICVNINLKSVIFLISHRSLMLVPTILQREFVSRI